MSHERARASLPQAIASNRFIGVDAARGLMMLFACLSHFAWWLHAVYPEASAQLATIGMVATPTFLLISGAMVGLMASGSTDLHGLRTKLLNRGLFLVTVGHLLISAAEAHQDGGLLQAIESSTIVDEIGLATVLASANVARLADARTAQRIAGFALLTFCASWSAVLIWHPSGHAGLSIKQVLLGGDLTESRLNVYTSPTVQYLSIYAMGLPLGHLVCNRRGDLTSRGDLSSRGLYANYAMILGLTLTLTASLLHLVGARWSQHLAIGALHDAVSFTTRISYKMPPAPLYLMFYAGAGLALSGALLWLAARHIGSFIMVRLATIGRASLFVFVLQYFLYWTLPDLLGIRVNRWCAAVFMLNVLLIYHAAAVWVRYRGNRWLTLGISLPRRDNGIPAS
jgi:hypothetical protein